MPSTLREAFAVADDVWMLPQLHEQLQICQAWRNSSRLAFEGSLRIQQFGQQLALLDSILQSSQKLKLLTVHGSPNAKEEAGSLTANTTWSDLSIPRFPLLHLYLLRDMCFVLLFDHAS